VVDNNIIVEKPFIGPDPREEEMFLIEMKASKDILSKDENDLSEKKTI